MRAHTALSVVVAGFLLMHTGQIRVDARQTAADPPSPPPAQADDDMLTAGREVQIRDAVTGDLAAAGRDVTIDADVAGYVMSAGRHVTLNGRVGNDLWAAGESVDVVNAIGNNAMIAGRSVTLHPDAAIAGNARLAGAMIRTEGHVARDLQASGSSVSIGGDVGGTVRASGEHVTVLPNAVIQGDVVVRSPNPPTISPAARIMGSVRHESPVERGGWMAWPAYWLWACVALLVLSGAAFLAAPRWSRQVADTLRARPAASLLAGLVVLVVVPMAIVAVAITIVGIPLAIVALATYVVLFLLSVVFVSYRLGDWILTRAHRSDVSRWMPILLGVIVLSLAMSIPVLGPLVSVVVVTWGLGAIVLERRLQRRTAVV